MYIVFRRLLTVIHFKATSRKIALCFGTQTSMLTSESVMWKFAWCFTIFPTKPQRTVDTYKSFLTFERYVQIFVKRKCDAFVIQTNMYIHYITLGYNE